MHLDIKPLARAFSASGTGFNGDRRAIVKGAGWEYAHVAVDDYSRVAYVEVLPDQSGRTAAHFLRRTVHWFARPGIVVHRVLTDNGGARSRPYRPQTNGKAERFIQTLLRECPETYKITRSSRRACSRKKLSRRRISFRVA